VPAALSRFDGRCSDLPMGYEPGTSECRLLIDSKAQLEQLLLNLARLEHTEAIREQLLAVHQQLEALHDQRRALRQSLLRSVQIA